MAEATVPLKQLDDVTECPICTDMYTDPRMLPCIHTFCLRCIEKWGKDKVKDGKLSCPLCRKEISVPDEGIAGLPKNFFMEKLLDVRKLSCALSEKEICLACDLCSDGSDSSVATAEVKKAAVYCAECRQNMCQQCAVFHGKSRLLSGHKTIEMDKKLSDVELITRMPDATCVEHPDEILKLYCFDCKLPTCMMCYVINHNSHKCSDVKQVAKELGSQIKAAGDGVESKAADCRKLLKEMTAENEKFVNMSSKAELEINETADKMKQLIDNYRTKLLAELAAARKEQEKKVETVKQEIEGRLLMIETFKKYCDELRDKGTACDIARAVSSLQVRAKELMEFNACTEFEIDLVDIKFTSTLSVGESEIVFGQLDIDVEEQVDLSSNPVHIIPGIVSAVTGVTSLADLVYLTRPSTQHISVYNVTSFALERNIALPFTTGRLSSLAACEVNQCIYMSDCDDSKMYRIELTGSNITLTACWSVGKFPRGVFVNKDKNVLVACEEANKIQEYTTRGTLVREIATHPDVTSPLNVVELPNDLLGITHNGSQHRFCIIGWDGRVVKSYGSSAGSGAGQLYNPYGLTVNKQGTVVFIGDFANNRIISLNTSTMTASQLTINNCGQLANPYCVHYDNSRHRLYIGELCGVHRVVILGQ